jgi:hypothetical protein
MEDGRAACIASWRDIAHDLGVRLGHFVRNHVAVDVEGGSNVRVSHQLLLNGVDPSREIAASAAVAGTGSTLSRPGPMILTARSNRPRAGSISGPYFGCRSQPCCTTVSCGRWNGPKTASRRLRLRIDEPNRAKQM